MVCSSSMKKLSVLQIKLPLQNSTFEILWSWITIGSLIFVLWTIWRKEKEDGTQISAVIINMKLLWQSSFLCILNGNHKSHVLQSTTSCPTHFDILCFFYLFLRNLVWGCTHVIILVSCMEAEVFNTRGKIIFWTFGKSSLCRKKEIKVYFFKWKK